MVWLSGVFPLCTLLRANICADLDVYEGFMWVCTTENGLEDAVARRRLPIVSSAIRVDTSFIVSHSALAPA